MRMLALLRCINKNLMRRLGAYLVQKCAWFNKDDDGASGLDVRLHAVVDHEVDEIFLSISL